MKREHIDTMTIPKLLHQSLSWQNFHNIVAPNSS